MITISITPEEITVSGHADYAPKGYDIVCAAISALTDTLIKSIHALTQDSIEAEEGEGKAVIYLRNPSEKTKTLVDSFFIGVSDVAAAYPENVRISE